MLVHKWSALKLISWAYRPQPLSAGTKHPTVFDEAFCDKSGSFSLSWSVMDNGVISLTMVLSVNFKWACHMYAVVGEYAWTLHVRDHEPGAMLFFQRQKSRNWTQFQPNNTTVKVSMYLSVYATPPVALSTKKCSTASSILVCHIHLTPIGFHRSTFTIWYYCS